MRDTSWDARARGAIIMKLNIDPHIFAGIAQLKAGKEDCRAELHGVYVEPRPHGGVIIQATNGHAAGLWLDTIGFAERPAILRADDEMVEHCALAQAGAVVSLVGGSLVLIGEKGQQEYAAKGPWELEGKFPDLRRSIPISNGDPALRDAINPKLLSQMRNVLKIGTGRIKGTIGVELRQNHNGAYAPIICTSASAPLFFGAMMPVRYAHAPQPGWVKAWVAAPLPAAPPAHEPSDAAPPDGDGGAQS